MRREKRDEAHAGANKPPAVDVSRGPITQGLSPIRGGPNHERSDVTKTCVQCGREFQYTPRPGRPPATCSADCQRLRKNSQSGQRWGANQKCPPELHGTASGYTNYKCGCPKCSRWARLYKQKQRATR